MCDKNEKCNYTIFFGREAARPKSAVHFLGVRKKMVMGYSSSHANLSNPREGYASLGVRALGFRVAPEQSGDVRVPVAGERVEDSRGHGLLKFARELE